MNVFQPIKPRRKPNWSEDETFFLVQLVQEHKAVIKGKFSSTLTQRHKRCAWVSITSKVNEAHGNNRTREEVEKRWHNVRAKAMKEGFEHRRAVQQTGGLYCC